MLTWYCQEMRETNWCSAERKVEYIFCIAGSSKAKALPALVVGRIGRSREQAKTHLAQLSVTEMGTRRPNSEMKEGTNNERTTRLRAVPREEFCGNRE